MATFIISGDKSFGGNAIVTHLHVREDHAVAELRTPETGYREVVSRGTLTLADAARMIQSARDEGRAVHKNHPNSGPDGKVARALRAKKEAAAKAA